jgi:hypothetical protein
MIVLGVISFLIYSDTAKIKISSILTKELTKEIGFQVDVLVKEISLSPSKISIKALLNDVFMLDISGRYTPWNHTMDLVYHLSSERVVFKDISFKDHIDIHGTIKGERKHLSLLAEGEGLEGRIASTFLYTPKALKDVSLQLKRVSSQKMMLLLGEEPLFSGDFSLDAKIPYFSDFEKKGEISATLHQSGLYLQNIQKRFHLQLPKDVILSAILEITLDGGVDYFKGNIISTLGEMRYVRGRYIEVDKSIHCEYELSIKELSRLRFLTKKEFVGPFHASGEIAYNDGIRFDGVSDTLDGEINYYYEKEDLEASFKDVSLEKLFRVLHYPPIMIGGIDGKIEYDIRENMALLNLRSSRLRFRETALTREIFATSGVNFADELFTHTIFASSIDDGIVSYDFKAENATSYLSLNDAKMDAKKNTITSNFAFKMQGEELSGEIYGSLKSPKVDIDIGKYVEFKATKEIDAFFGKGTTNEVKNRLKEVDVEDVKGFIKEFF